MNLAVVIFVAACLYIVVWAAWPPPKCPHCGSRESLSAAFPKTPGFRHCCRCHRRWDSWQHKF